MSNSELLRKRAEKKSHDFQKERAKISSKLRLVELYLRSLEQSGHLDQSERALVANARKKTGLVAQFLSGSAGTYQRDMDGIYSFDDDE